MKAFVTYLKKESPAMQLPSGSTGWIELPNGQRWNPGHTYKFNAHESVQMTNQRHWLAINAAFWCCVYREAESKPSSFLYLRGPEYRAVPVCFRRSS
ncbi:hypothetical protein C1984_12445 [Salmonella enterica]|nr:hypothetical protein [Salmonella enterica]EAX9807530.1 hypothetical protein [Salmonella enterica]EBD6710103.1 hypothetical protein [Salmonella enterica]EBQ7835968.1 hypothetical protein [Salmonella enterica]ECE2126263.1 hypothetical protein [Salmonella enterica]